METFVFLAVRLLDIYFWIITAAVIVSWLVAFGVLNMRNRYVYKACELLNRLTQPPMQFLRRFVPVIGGIDITPMIIIFGLIFLQRLLMGLL